MGIKKSFETKPSGLSAGVNPKKTSAQVFEAEFGKRTGLHIDKKGNHLDHVTTTNGTSAYSPFSSGTRYRNPEG